MFLRASRESWINLRLLVLDSDFAGLNNSESGWDKDTEDTVSFDGIWYTINLSKN